MTEKENQEQRIRLNWTDAASKSGTEFGGVEYAVSVDLVGSSGKNDWEWLVWVNGQAHFAPRLSERLTQDRDQGLEKGKHYAEHVAYNAEEMKERRTEARQ